MPIKIKGGIYGADNLIRAFGNMHEFVAAGLMQSNILSAEDLLDYYSALLETEQEEPIWLSLLLRGARHACAMGWLQPVNGEQGDKETGESWPYQHPIPKKSERIF